MQIPIPPNPSDRVDAGDSESIFSFNANRTPYEALGDACTLRGLVDTFYNLMDRDARYGTIRSLHQESLTNARGKLYEFLSGWLGGPPLYVEKYGHPRLRGRHMPFSIGEAERDLWLACMSEAMDACDVKGEIREFLNARFAHVANFMRNQ